MGKPDKKGFFTLKNCYSKKLLTFLVLKNVIAKDKAPETISFNTTFSTWIIRLNNFIYHINYFKGELNLYIRNFRLPLQCLLFHYYVWSSRLVHNCTFQRVLMNISGLSYGFSIVFLLIYSIGILGTERILAVEV